MDIGALNNANESFDTWDECAAEQGSWNSWDDEVTIESRPEKCDEILALKGKGGKKGKGKGKGKNGKSTSQITCWWCNKPGHQIVDCWELQNLKEKRPGSLREREKEKTMENGRVVKRMLMLLRQVKLGMASLAWRV